MKSRLYTIVLTSIIYFCSTSSHAVLIGSKDWNQLWAGPYSSVTTWVDMAVIFDPMTGKCISTICDPDEYWASASDVIELYDIAGPDGLSSFADTFADPPSFSVIHGVVRDIFIENSQPLITEAVISCDDSNVLACNSPEIFGSGTFSLSDDFSFTQGVYIGVWTYRQVVGVPAPSGLAILSLIFSVMWIARSGRYRKGVIYCEV